MKRKGCTLQRTYQAALHRYLKKGPAASVHPAQRLGRQAVSLGLETLDLALIHEQALLLAVAAAGDVSSASRNDIVERAGKFFAEAILPMEATHRTAIVKSFLKPMPAPCVITAESVHPDLARCLHSLMFHARAIHGESLEGWVRKQRLGPVVYGVGGAVDEFFSASFLDECRHAYFHMIGRSHGFLAEAERVKTLLIANGIDALAWRGAVYGQDLYGDSGLRCYSDLDILISPAYQRRALSVLCRAGYRLRKGILPAWFLARHHLHWPLVSPDGRVPVDVHWALDHPYTSGPRVSTDVFLEDKKGVAQILLAALHVEKETRLRTCVNEDDLRNRLFVVGPVWPWLDLAVMINAALRNSRERELDVLAEMHGASALMSRVRFVLSRWFDVAGSGQFVFRPQTLGGNIAERQWAVRLAECMGCRADVLLDWVEYLREPVSWHERTIRALRILRLACDSALVGVYGFGRWLLKQLNCSC